MSVDAVAPIRRALISVSNKNGLDAFSLRLTERGIQLLSTGGTKQFLEGHQIPVQGVSEYTGYPEIMGGRVKTLHPKIHGGILARRGMDESVMSEQNIEGIDLVVVNLYPFQQTIAQPDCDLALAIENIDIGGPTMVRAAAKNHKDVAVVVDPDDYPRILSEIEMLGGISAATRFWLATKAFAHTAEYDGAIANFLQKQLEKQSATISENSTEVEDNTVSGTPFPKDLLLSFRKKNDLRYGENPHQRAAFYAEANPPLATLATAKQWQGKALSYNNIADTDAALECVKSFSQAACVIVKHANPCGVALGINIMEAYQRAFAADRTSAFGGIIAFNRVLDGETAQMIVSQQFAEVIVAPEISKEALTLFSDKPNLRVLTCGTMSETRTHANMYKQVSGGLLVQTADQKVVAASDMKVVSSRQPTEKELEDLQFSWKVVKYVKSNAIVYAQNGQSIGIGAGQMSRVISAKIAAMKAEEEGLPVKGAVMASDAFFPFRDGIDAAAQLGIRAVIQPGGSIRDQTIIDAANEHDMAMIFTGVRHFLH